MSTTDSPLEQLPPPVVIHRRMGHLYRELTLLRRLLRLSQQAARNEQSDAPSARPEVSLTEASRAS
jgi:hypothetical protein